MPEKGRNGAVMGLLQQQGTQVAHPPAWVIVEVESPADRHLIALSDPSRFKHAFIAHACLPTACAEVYP